MKVVSFSCRTKDSRKKRERQVKTVLGGKTFEIQGTRPIDYSQERGIKYGKGWSRKKKCTQGKRILEASGKKGLRRMTNIARGCACRKGLGTNSGEGDILGQRFGKPKMRNY